MLLQAEKRAWTQSLLAVVKDGDTFVAFHTNGNFRLWRNGKFTFFQRCLQPLYLSRSPPPTQSSLFCAGVQVSCDSIRAFNDWIKIPENRGLSTVCDDWENVEARALYTGCACVVKSNSSQNFRFYWHRNKWKVKMLFKAIRQDMTCFGAGHHSLWSEGVVAHVASMRLQCKAAAPLINLSESMPHRTIIKIISWCPQIRARLTRRRSTIVHRPQQWNGNPTRNGPKKGSGSKTMSWLKAKNK